MDLVRVLYVLAGAGAIVALVGSIVLDVQKWRELFWAGCYSDPGRPARRRRERNRHALIVAVLLVLWLTAALLR